MLRPEFADMDMPWAYPAPAVGTRRNDPPHMASAIRRAEMQLALEQCWLEREMEAMDIPCG
jgi:hypothetical protein